MVEEKKEDDGQPSSRFNRDEDSLLYALVDQYGRGPIVWSEVEGVWNSIDIASIQARDIRSLQNRWHYIVRRSNSSQNNANNRSDVGDKRKRES